MRDIKGKRVLILGLGRSGLAAAARLIEENTHIYAYDRRRASEIGSIPSEVNLMSHSESENFDLGFIDFALISPGIPPYHPIVQKLMKEKVPILSELQLGMRYLPKGTRIIAVTGTNGKTTTTELLSFLTGGVAAGNIGRPLSEVALDIKKDTLLILEVSSFQLYFSENFLPDVGVILNISPEHIDWHGSYDAYAESKLKLFRSMSPDSFAVYNYEAPLLKSFFSTLMIHKIPFSSMGSLDEGICIKDNIIHINMGGNLIEYEYNSSILPGKHNLENLMGALGAAFSLGISSFPSINRFRLSPHRMEYFQAGNITFINDSKATNLDSTLRALESLEEDLIILMGGRSKGVSNPSLAKEIKRKARQVIAFGESREEVFNMVKGAVPVKQLPTLREAVEEAVFLAGNNKTKILLSPGGSSYDEFKNYEERGNKYKEWAVEYTTKVIKGI